MNVVEWLLAEKIATHWKQAQNIIVGLRLFELHTRGDYEGIKARARLYRDWRNSKVYPDRDTASCFEKAIAGEPVKQMALIQEALRSEVENV